MAIEREDIEWIQEIAKETSTKVEIAEKNLEKAIIYIDRLKDLKPKDLSARQIKSVLKVVKLIQYYLGFFHESLKKLSSERKMIQAIRKTDGDDLHARFETLKVKIITKEEVFMKDIVSTLGFWEKTKEKGTPPFAFPGSKWNKIKKMHVKKSVHLLLDKDMEVAKDYIILLDVVIDAARKAYWKR